MQLIFGIGALWGQRSDVASVGPDQFAILQDNTIDFSFELKELYSQLAFPVDIARGKGKVTGKAKMARVFGALYADLFFGTTTTTGETTVEVIMCPTMTQKLPRPRVAAGGINQPNGIGLSPDGKFLFVSEYGGTNVWSFMLNPDGTLWAGERYMELRAPVNRPQSGGDGMAVDESGRAFITSYVGIQMFDGTGRLSGVIAKPSDKGCVSVAFAGPDRSWLYACASDKVFRRKTLTKGFYMPDK